MLAALTTSVAQNVLKSVVGLHWVQEVSLFPLATGMALTMLLLTMKASKPKADYVVFSRIDQKTCLKCIVTANLKPIVINLKEDEKGGLGTDIEGIEKAIDEHGSTNILCVFSVLSCFAPRNYDNVAEIARVCAAKKVFHVVNNAYGLQCSKCSAILNSAIKAGSLDAVVSSFDKNLLVPVGGSLVYSGTKGGFARKTAEAYPGRASISPLLDLLITLLEMGREGLKKLLKERKELYVYAKEKAKEVMAKYGESVIENVDNKISIGVTLSKLVESSKKEAGAFGAHLYTRRVSGVRVVEEGKKTVCGVEFKNYGSHTENYSKLPYLTFAVAIGSKKEEVLLE